MAWLLDEVAYIQENLTSFKRKDNEACIEAYSTAFPTSRGNLLVVTEDNTTSNSLLDWEYPDQLMM